MTPYEKIVQATGIPFDPREFDGVEEYKGHIVRYVDANIGDEEFDAFPNDLRDWLIDATIVVKENRKARNKRNIAPIPGFPFEDDASTTSLRQRLRDGLPKNKRPKAQKSRPRKPLSENRFARVAAVMIDHPGRNWQQILDLMGPEYDADNKSRVVTMKGCVDAFHAVCYALRAAGLLPADFDTAEAPPVPRKPYKARKHAQPPADAGAEAMPSDEGGEFDEVEDELEDELENSMENND